MDQLQWMEQWNMLPKGGVVLCAVSGGQDSLCLLHYLHSLGPHHGFSVAAGHLNHQMRPEAAADEAFVREFCAAREIPFYTEAVPVYERAEQWQVSVEEAGRRARYDFLLRTAEAIGAQRIATAHHADDNAETVLLNLLRGSGSEGLGGIPPVRGPFIRPLLTVRRADIEAYCAQHGLSHVEDSTNRDTHYARARLRLELWPQLETVNSGVTAALNRTAALLREENAYLDALAAARLPAEGTGVALDTLRQTPEVLRRRMLRLLLERLPSAKKDVTAAHIAEGLALVEKGRGTLMLPDGARMTADGKDLLCFVELPPPPPLEMHAGENHWGDFLLTVSAPCPHLTVRSWHSRDRLAVETGSRSLKRLFADAGIQPTGRALLPVVCVKDAPVGVYLGEEPCEITLPVEDGVCIVTIKRKHFVEDRTNG